MILVQWILSKHGLTASCACVPMLTPVAQQVVDDMRWQVLMNILILLL
jgi:hypothetical protein